MIVFRIPTPPSTNNLFANVAGRGRVRSAAYGTWANAAGWAMKASAQSWPMLSDPVDIEINLGAIRGDIDNRAKGCLDLMVAMNVIKDDSLVHRLVITKGAGDPKVAIVTVRPLYSTSDARSAA